MACLYYVWKLTLIHEPPLPASDAGGLGVASPGAAGGARGLGLGLGLGRGLWSLRGRGLGLGLRSLRGLGLGLRSSRPSHGIPCI
jgi:hypothetical protein